MKSGGISFIDPKCLVLVVVIVLSAMLAPANCQTKDVLLLLEQTPATAGETTPGTGVYRFKPGSQVLLKAHPKPGYQFVQWLGDVSDATANSTVVYLNKPKVIVAVFEQAAQSAKKIPAGGEVGGGGGLMPTAVNFFPQGGISPAAGGGGGKPQPVTYMLDTKKPTPEVPEPATGLLMVVGSLFAFARRRAGRRA